MKILDCFFSFKATYLRHKRLASSAFSAGVYELKKHLEMVSQCRRESKRSGGSVAESGVALK